MKRRYADVSDFREYLLHPENRKQLSFQLREDGYGDTRPRTASAAAGTIAA